MSDNGIESVCGILRKDWPKARRAMEDLECIHAILHPDGDPDHEHNADTLEDIKEIVYEHIPYPGDPKATQARWEPCSEGCPGWALFSTNTERGYEIERCDECDRFASDEDAWAFVRGNLGACSLALFMTLKELNHLNRRSPRSCSTARAVSGSHVCTTCGERYDEDQEQCIVCGEEEDIIPEEGA